MKKPCQLICKKFKPKRNATISPYKLGFGWCKVCKTYLEKCVLIDEKRCPCCKNQVRFRPKNKNRKKIVMEIKRR